MANAVPYAQKYYRNFDGGCPVFGLRYVADLPEDRRLHRSHHRQVLKVFQPQPNKALAKKYSEFGWLVPITVISPPWLHKRLHDIATMLRRENGYDFIMWDAPDRDGGCGYIFADAEGRARGGCAVRWLEYSNAPPNWVLQWVWVAPAYRRQGLMRLAWEELIKRFEGIYPEPPFTRAAALFFKDRSELPEVTMSHVDGALNEQGTLP